MSSEFVPYPMPERLETERLVLLKPDVAFAKMSHASVIESLEDLKPWLVWAHNQTLESAVDFMKSGVEEWAEGSDFGFVVFEKGKEGTLEGHVGNMGFNKLKPEMPSFDIGYWCRSSKQGKGYVKEVASFLTEYALNEMGCKRLQIRVDSENDASNGVAKAMMAKHGYIFEGMKVNDDYFAWRDQPLRDTNYYVITSK